MYNYETLTTMYVAETMNGKSAEEACEAVNTLAKFEAIKSAQAEPVSVLRQLIDGITYPAMRLKDGNPDQITRALRARDFFALKDVKAKDDEPQKAKLDPVLFSMLAVFGKNAVENFTSSANGCVAMLKAYTQYKLVENIDCFTCETATSNGKLEEQLQSFAHALYGEDAPQMRKAHVKMLKDSFIQAKRANVNTGKISRYATGNEIALLECIIDRIHDAKIGIVTYKIDSRLATFRKPKDEQ